MQVKVIYKSNFLTILGGKLGRFELLSKDWKKNKLKLILPMTKRMLNTADPTIVPMPTSLNAIKTPIMEVNNSGAEPPAAIKVAPATSSDIPIFSIEGKNIKFGSHFDS